MISVHHLVKRRACARGGVSVVTAAFVAIFVLVSCTPALGPGCSGSGGGFSVLDTVWVASAVHHADAPISDRDEGQEAMNRLLEEFDDVWPELTAAIRHARETGEDEPLKRLIDEALLRYDCDGMESYTP